MKNPAAAERDACPDAPPAPAEQHESLLRAIARAPSGLSVGEIERQGGGPVARRTLQRRLTRLVQEGVLHTSGQGRGTRYLLGAHAHGTACGYDHTLIAEYRPNLDAYLSAMQRQGFRALNRALRARHSATLKAGPGAPLMTLLAPCWSFEFIWNSSRLAGGRYDRDEAASLLETGSPPPGRPPWGAQVLLNHRAAADFIRAPGRAIDDMALRNLHAMLTDNLLADPAEGGLLRAQHYALAPRNPAQVLRLLVERANAIEDPFEQSFFLFLHLSCLQLFAHGNARLARAAANLPLLRADLCPVTFPETSLPLYRHAQHETGAGPRLHLLRELYVRAYEESCGQCARFPMPGALNPLRLRYRKELSAMVRSVVEAGMGRREAAGHLADPQAGDGHPPALREIAMEELDALHAGNIFRHGLSLEDYLAWRSAWMREG